MYSSFSAPNGNPARSNCSNSSMETLDSESPSPSTTTASKPQPSSPLPSSVLRLWRQAAQRNLRNRWTQLASYKDQWSSISSAARSHATALVNSHLSIRYIITYPVILIIHKLFHCVWRMRCLWLSCCCFAIDVGTCLV